MVHDFANTTFRTRLFVRVKMDLLLFAASAGLGASLPKEDTAGASKSVKVALGLSLGLLSLSILEAAPSQWMVLLEHDNSTVHPHGSLTISGAYRLILWIVCTCIVVILPGSIGGHIFSEMLRIQRRKFADADEKKYQRPPWRLPWWIRYLFRIAFSMILLMYRLVAVSSFRLIRRSLGRQSHEPVLVMTNNDGGSRHGSRHGGSRHGPKSPLNQRKDLLPFSRPFLLGSFAGILTTILLLRTLGPLVIEVRATQSQVLSTLVSWLCAVGLVISSVLNGFGCASMPYNFLVGWSLESVRPEAIARAERELNEANQSMESKLAELKSDASMSQSSTNWRHTSYAKKSFSDYGGEAHQHKLMLQKEIDFLDVLTGELRVDIAEMKHSYETALQARTTLGRLRTYLGFVFSLVLLIRLYTSLLSILKGSIDDSKKSDPVTTTLLWLAGHHYVSVDDYNKFSQGISLLLTAFLSVSQVRTLLGTVSSVTRRIDLIYKRCYCTSKGAQALGFEQSYKHIYTRVVAALMGCYFVACVVLTKLNLPIEYRSEFGAALGGMAFTIRSSVVNLVFALSSAISAALMAILLGIQRQNSKRYANEATRTTPHPC